MSPVIELVRICCHYYHLFNAGGFYFWSMFQLAWTVCG